jgi:beta-lactam-binding protein with PASTA domain
LVKEWKNILISLTVFLGGLLLLAVLMDTIIMRIVVRHGDECFVPYITNMSLKAARVKLNEGGLKLAVAQEEFSSEYSKGTIISQLPESGATVKKGMGVRVIVSKGSASAVVPNLRGVTLREAKFMLEREGLAMGDILWYNDETLPDGVIIESRPTTSTVMKLNAEVLLVINRRQTDILVAVPDFVGFDLSEVMALAEENNLLIGEISYKVDDRMLPETVLFQSIAPNSQVQKWTVINLTVSQPE